MGRLLVAGDEILEINGVEVRNKSVDDVVELMASVNGTVTFLIVPGQETANGGVSEKVVSDLITFASQVPIIILFTPMQNVS